jgi:hypothetical protein
MLPEAVARKVTGANPRNSASTSSAPISGPTATVPLIDPQRVTFKPVAMTLGVPRQHG